MRAGIRGLLGVAAIILMFAGSAEADWFKLVAPDLGWAVEPPNQLLWKNDGGLHWKVLGLPVPRGSSISAVFLFDKNRGCALLSRGEPVAGLQFIVALTQDGGANWSVQPLTMPTRLSQKGFNGGASLAFSDPLHGITILDIGFTPIPGGGAVLVTSDGGKTWQARPHGMQGEVTLVTPQLAWVVAGGVNEELYVTRDGAMTWQKVEIPSPTESDLLKQSKANAEQFWKSYLQGLNPAETAEANDTRQRQSQTFGHYERPLFKDANHGYIVVSYPGVVVLFATTDGGVTWKADRVVTGTGIGKSSVADSPGSAPRFLGMVCLGSENLGLARRRSQTQFLGRRIHHRRRLVLQTRTKDGCLRCEVA